MIRLTRAHDPIHTFVVSIALTYSGLVRTYLSQGVSDDRNMTILHSCTMTAASRERKGHLLPFWLGPNRSEQFADSHMPMKSATPPPPQSSLQNLKSKVTP